MSRVIHTGQHSSDIFSLTDAQYAALIVVLAASEYDANAPRTCLSKETGGKAPWNMRINARVAAFLENKGLVCTRVVLLGERHEIRVDVTRTASAAFDHTPWLRAEVDAMVAELRARQQESTAEHGRKQEPSDVG